MLSYKESEEQDQDHLYTVGAARKVSQREHIHVSIVHVKLPAAAFKFIQTASVSLGACAVLQPQLVEKLIFANSMGYCNYASQSYPTAKRVRGS